jgi:hypothetical protein
MRRFDALAERAEAQDGALLRNPGGGYVLAWRSRCGIDGRQVGTGWQVAARGTFGRGTGRTPQEAIEGTCFDGGRGPVVYATLDAVEAELDEEGSR